MILLLRMDPKWHMEMRFISLCRCKTEELEENVICKYLKEILRGIYARCR